jgi:hypothetical protein
MTPKHLAKRLLLLATVAPEALKLRRPGAEVRPATRLLRPYADCPRGSHFVPDDYAGWPARGRGARKRAAARAARQEQADIVITPRKVA